MNPRELGPRWSGIADARWQAIIKRADDIRTLKDRGCAVEALQSEHDAIELILTSLGDAVLSGAGQAEIIEILNAALDFCGAHFADEEEFMRKGGHAQLDAHVSAHRHLVAKLMAVRRSAKRDGLSLATLDAVDLLHDFHEHVRTYDRAA